MSIRKKKNLEEKQEGDKMGEHSNPGYSRDIDNNLEPKGMDGAHTFDGGTTDISNPLRVEISDVAHVEYIHNISEPDTPTTLQPPGRSWRGVQEYLASQKGRELTMGSSVMYALTLTVIGLAILFSKALNNLYKNSADVFYLWMYCSSLLCMTALLCLSKIHRLTTDNHYKDQRKMAFLRGGMLALGTGGMIYYATVLAIFIMDGSECEFDVELANAIIAMITIITQIIFLFKYSKLRINKNLTLTVLGRFFLMQIIATNLCVWLRTVIKESMHDIDRINGYHGNDHGKTYDKNGTNYTDDYKKTDCYSSSDLSEIIAPYTFPLLIEFCVVASTMLLAVWEKCGVGFKLDNDDAGSFKDSDLQERSRRISQESTPQRSPSPSDLGKKVQNIGEDSYSPSNYYNTNKGFLYGWLVIVVSLVIVIVCLYATYSDEDYALENIIYASNIVLTIFCLISIPVTAYRMSDLTFKDEEIKFVRKGEENIKRPRGVTKGLDKDLLGVTFVAMLTFKVMSMIAAYEHNDTIVFVDGILSIICGYMQTSFLNWYAFQKRSTTERHRQKKPGRQGLDFLRCTNFSLWLINTFLLKHAAAKQLQEDTFGALPWAIISNIVQPLTILFFFHAMICYAEVITHSYSTKYIGLVRPSKSRRISGNNSANTSGQPSPRYPLSPLQTAPRHRSSVSSSVSENQQEDADFNLYTLTRC